MHQGHAGMQENGTGRGYCGQGVAWTGGCGWEMLWKSDAMDRVIPGARGAVGWGMEWAGKLHGREML